MINRVSFCLIFGIAHSQLTPSVNSDCAALGNCLPSLTQYVNKALGEGGSVNFTLDGEAVDSVPGRVATLADLNQTSVMSFTINQCADVLQNQLTAFKKFQQSNIQVWNDVTLVQKSLVAVEAAANDILTTESGFTTQLGQIGELFGNTTKRVEDLGDWVKGQKVVRNQLTELFNELDQKVVTTSNDIVVTTSTIRDALINMQKAHDHATKILTAVGDAETQMYLWAFNVSQKVNQHTVNLVSIAQTLQYRTNQISAVKVDNINLNWIVTQLANKYGADKLKELAAKYDAGTLEIPSNQAQTLNSTSKTAETRAGMISK